MVLEEKSLAHSEHVEEFDDYWPCTKKTATWHVNNWLNLFVVIHYATRRYMRFGDL